MGKLLKSLFALFLLVAICHLTLQVSLILSLMIFPLTLLMFSFRFFVGERNPKETQPSKTC